MNRILIAVDGSPAAAVAARFGLELAAEQHAEPTFVLVAPAVDVFPTCGFGLSAALPHEVTANDRRPLEDALALASEVGLHARAELLRGDPVDEIVAFADSLAADLIVVGSRGHGALAGALLGSVSRGILRETRRPVLVVRGAAGRGGRLSRAGNPQREPQSAAAGFRPATDGTGAVRPDTGATKVAGS